MGFFKIPVFLSFEPNKKQTEILIKCFLWFLPALGSGVQHTHNMFLLQFLVADLNSCFDIYIFLFLCLFECIHTVRFVIVIHPSVHDSICLPASHSTNYSRVWRSVYCQSSLVAAVDWHVCRTWSVSVVSHRTKPASEECRCGFLSSGRVVVLMSCDCCVSVLYTGAGAALYSKSQRIKASAEQSDANRSSPSSSSSSSSAHRTCLLLPPSFHALCSRPSGQRKSRCPLHTTPWEHGAPQRQILPPNHLLLLQQWGTSWIFHQV